MSSTRIAHLSLTFPTRVICTHALLATALREEVRLWAYLRDLVSMGPQRQDCVSGLGRCTYGRLRSLLQVSCQSAAGKEMVCSSLTESRRNSNQACRPGSLLSWLLQHPETRSLRVWVGYVLESKRDSLANEHQSCRSCDSCINQRGLPRRTNYPPMLGD